MFLIHLKSLGFKDFQFYQGPSFKAYWGSNKQLSYDYLTTLFPLVTLNIHIQFNKKKIVVYNYITSSEFKNHIKIGIPQRYITPST